MPSDTTAIVIACVSGGVSLSVAGGAEWARRRLDQWKAEQEWELEAQRSEQAKELEAQRSQQEKELEELRDKLARSREAAAKADEAERLVAKYRDPLLRAAFDLQSRIYNVYRPRGFKGGRDPEYFRLNTLFLLAEFLGWLELIRREMQFLDLGAVGSTKQLRLKLDEVQHRLASTSSWRDDFYVYRGQQRAIGELMLTRVEEETSSRRRHECIGYAAFVEAQNRPEFVKWFEWLADAVTRLPNTDQKPTRLVFVQHALIDLIDLLDPDLVWFPENRDRLAAPNSST